MTLPLPAGRSTAGLAGPRCEYAAPPAALVGSASATPTGIASCASPRCAACAPDALPNATDIARIAVAVPSMLSFIEQAPLSPRSAMLSPPTAIDVCYLGRHYNASTCGRQGDSGCRNI